MNATHRPLTDVQLLASKHAADKTRGLTLAELEELLLDAWRIGVPSDARADAVIGSTGLIQRIEVFG